MTPERETNIRAAVETLRWTTDGDAVAMGLGIGNMVIDLLAAHDAQRTRAEAAERQLAGLREAAQRVVSEVGRFLSEWMNPGGGAARAVLPDLQTARAALDAALADSAEAGARVIAEAEERGRLAEKMRIDAEEDAATWEWEREQVAATAAAIRERDALRAEVERLKREAAAADLEVEAGASATIAAITAERDEAKASGAESERMLLEQVAITAQVTRERDEALAALGGAHREAHRRIVEAWDATGQGTDTPFELRHAVPALDAAFKVPPADLAAAYTRRVRAEGKLEGLRWAQAVCYARSEEFSKLAAAEDPTSIRHRTNLCCEQACSGDGHRIRDLADRIERGETT